MSRAVRSRGGFVPEGDAVWRTARRLDRALSGSRLSTADFRVPSLATVDLSGALVRSTRPRGKHLLTRLAHPDQGEVTVHTHLKMEGSWQVYASGQRWRRPAEQARVVLRTPTNEAVGFSLGVVELLPTSGEGALLAHLGPDLLGPDWDPDLAADRLRSHPERAIHAALLDQRNLAGIGNMYAAELCFLAGIHPQCPVSRVPDLHRLLLRAHQVLNFNKTQSSAVTTGDVRNGHRLWVYRRDGQPCLRCGTPIQVHRFETGRHDPARHDTRLREEQLRAAYWCPSCQPEGT